MCIVPRAIVDSHHHLWRLDTGSYPWLQQHYDPRAFILGDYAALCRDFGVAEYRAATENQPIVATVHVEAERERSQALAETAWLHQLQATHGLPDAVVAWVDLLAPDADERLAEQVAYPRVRGVRFKPLTARRPEESVRARPGALQDARWPGALERLRRLGLSWDLRVPFWHLEEAAALVAEVPGLPVVLEHAGLPSDRSDAGLTAWRRGMAALARHEQVQVKLSEFGLRDAPWRFDDNALIVRETVAIFGWQRCMFGSNFPVASLRVDCAALVRAMSGALVHLPPEARRAIWHDNAMRFYRIDPRQQPMETTP
ncbi:amidohydrolase [Rhizobacter sp. Root1221]|uniref:amidohydrolase family protein n=1 Tax=Rhizobacter sp. Root1221 TaxID=1736433 RepID=UPI0006FE21AB|nr:amidohydrolase family protein [Rhizobacter sp. Root1221]KQW00833.1 amidohydrolase [Rhizobacter sp. Root1221]